MMRENDVDNPEKKPPEFDFDLLNFDEYEDYLDSLATKKDKCYLQSVEACRMIAAIGYRRDGVTLSREEFLEKRKNVEDYLAPIKLAVKASTGFRFGDPAQNALAIRERANRIGMLTTIIFISYVTPKGSEISGYIDYAHSLLKRDWTKFFKNNEPIYPEPTDLGYFDWKRQKTIVNDSLFYKTLMSARQGLMFQNKFDRLIIAPDPYLAKIGHQSSRTKVKTKMYSSFVIIDHVLRSKK